MANKLIVAPAPHVHGSESTQKIMRDVLLALTPALVFSVVAFGWSALAVTCISVASCVLFEYLIQKFLLKGPCTVSDLSAVVTGVLLAFNLPASLPWWIVVIGAFVSIAIAKMTFGGLGKNPFNPALVGRVFLLFAYPVQMTTFPRPVGQLADAFSGATPLAAVKAELVSHTSVNYQDVLFGSIPGSLGEVSALLLLVGAVYLLWRKVITWHIPVAVLGTMAVFVFLVGLGQGMHGEALWEFPLFHLLAGRGSDSLRDYRNHREGHAFAPGGQRFVEVHAESQSDDAVLQQFFRSLLAPDRKRIAEGQGEENAREERDDGRTEERTYEQSGKKDLAPVELCGLHGFRELQRFHTVLITFCKRCCKYTGFIPLKQRGKSYVV